MENGKGISFWRQAWKSTTDNAVPMLVLWALAAIAVWSYYCIPAAARFLEPLRDWQSENGAVAAFASRFLFCGLLPGVFMVTMRHLALPRPLLVIAVQSVWSGLCGIVSGWMFSLHAMWLGTGIGFWTLAAKTVLNQFVWTPLFFAPAGAVVYFWIGRDFSLRRMRGDWPDSFWRVLVMPNLVANWIVWIPVAMLIHMFPTPLQIQLAGFANSFLCLVLLSLGKRK